MTLTAEQQAALQVYRQRYADVSRQQAIIEEAEADQAEADRATATAREGYSASQEKALDAAEAFMSLLVDAPAVPTAAPPPPRQRPR